MHIDMSYVYERLVWDLAYVAVIILASMAFFFGLFREHWNFYLRAVLILFGAGFFIWAIGGRVARNLRLLRSTMDKML